MGTTDFLEKHLKSQVNTIFLIHFYLSLWNIQLKSLSYCSSELKKKRLNRQWRHQWNSQKCRSGTVMSHLSHYPLAKPQFSLWIGYRQYVRPGKRNSLRPPPSLPIALRDQVFQGIALIVHRERRCRIPVVVKLAFPSQFSLWIGYRQYVCPGKRNSLRSPTSLPIALRDQIFQGITLIVHRERRCKIPGFSGHCLDNASWKTLRDTICCQIDLPVSLCIVACNNKCVSPVFGPRPLPGPPISQLVVVVVGRCDIQLETLNLKPSLSVRLLLVPRFSKSELSFWVSWQTPTQYEPSTLSISFCVWVVFSC